MAELNTVGQAPAIRGLGVSASIVSVVLAYATFASLWILLSDHLVEWLFRNPASITLASTLKGWLFVAITSLLLYTLMQRMLGSGVAILPTKTGPWPKLPLLLLSTTILVLTGIGISNSVSHEQGKEIARLQAIADLKTRQIGDWLQERQGDAQFVHTSTFIASLYRQWQEQGDTASGKQLQTRLEQLRQARNFGAITVLTPTGKRLWGSSAAPQDLAPDLTAALTLAIKDQSIHRVGPYLDTGGKIRLDLIVPVAGEASIPLIVLHISPEDWLYPTLRTWPVPSSSGESLLFRRDGDQVLFLSDLRLRKDSALKLRLPLTNRNLLATKLLLGNAAQGELVVGQDYRGVPSIGVIRAIPGSAWYLVAKMDEAESYEGAVHEGVWIGMAGLLALFMVGAGAYLLRQRQALAIATQVQYSQAEQLRALQLLDSISNSSTDAIFAKDTAGRYLLFNREACRLTGKDAEEVLGKDDTALLTADEARQIMANDQRVMRDNQSISFQERINTRDGELTMLATKGPLRDNEGRVIGMFGISRDITERAQVAEALRASEQRYRLVLDNAAEAVFVVTPEGNLDYANQELAEMLGCVRQDLRSLKLTDLVAPADLAQIESRLNQLQSPEHLRTELKLIRHDGGTLSVELNAVRLPGGNLYGACRDITLRKRAEAYLLRQSEELRARNDELERFNRVSVGRELEMIQLKQKINELAQRLGEAQPYPLAFLDQPPPEEARP